MAHCRDVVSLAGAVTFARMRGMDKGDQPCMDVLLEAQRRAAALVEELSGQIQELDADVPDVPPQALAEGKKAMASALASARRMLENLDGAMKIAPVSSN